MKNSVLILLTVFVFTYSSRAQDSTKNDPITLKFSMNYNSGLNYYGRIDSLQSSGVFPMAELWLAQKFYINAAPVFIHNKVSALEYAGSIATLGYVHSTDHWFTHFYALKPFYKESSQLVQAALKVQTGVSFSYLNRIVNLTIGGDAKYSDKIDFGATAGLDHVFRIEGKNQAVWVINPNVSVNVGTQHFSRTYSKTKGRIFPRQQQVTEQVQEFNLLSYEASIPIIYTKGQFQILLTPAYVLPQNLLQVPSQPELSEYGKNMFYTTLSVKYSL